MPPPSNNPKCYYTLLGLTPTATLADLRSSYRRLALLHHPDKNPGREDEATQSFAQIQHAYQVLSDPQERAWYDRIRAEQQREHHHTSKRGQNRWGTEEVLRLFEADVYSGYDDNPKGFFSIFRQVFEHLENLEGAVDDDQVTFFGSLHSPFEPAVKTFYDKWLGFNSRRTDFVVPNDAYFEHYQQGVNRRDRRYLEKERDKQRDVARREYSEAVRNLAAYVRKRDPRYKTYLLQKKKANQEQEELRKRQAKEAKRQANFVQQEWTKLDKEEEELLRRLEQLDFFSEEEDEEEEEEFYCVACKKTFKSQEQWKNHEQSRKHLTELEKFKSVEGDSESIESVLQSSAEEFEDVTEGKSMKQTLQHPMLRRLLARQRTPSLVTKSPSKSLQGRRTGQRNDLQALQR